MDLHADLSGIVFVVSTLVLGIMVLGFARRRGVTGLETSPHAPDMGFYLDPVVQADVYLSRGWRAQARSILEEAVRLDPARDDLRKKLQSIG